MKPIELAVRASRRALQNGHALLEADAAVALKFLCLEIAEALKAGESVTLPNLGRLMPKTMKATWGVNPRTGKIMTLPERAGVKFKEATGLRNDLRKKGE